MDVALGGPQAPISEEETTIAEMCQLIPVWISRLTFSTFWRMLTEIVHGLSHSCPATAAPTACVHSPPPPPPPPPETPPHPPPPPPPPPLFLAREPEAPPAHRARFTAMRHLKGRRSCARRLLTAMEARQKLKGPGSDRVPSCFFTGMRLCTHGYAMCTHAMTSILALMLVLHVSHLLMPAY